MIVTITTKENWNSINRGVQETGDDITDNCIKGSKKFTECIAGYIRLHPQIIIIDVLAIDDMEKVEAKKAIQSIRIMSENSRIMLVLPGDAVPGDIFISELVGMGIWDIIHNTDIKELPDKIKDCINNPTPYRIAVRWQQSSEGGKATSAREIVRTITKTETIIKQIKNKVVLVANLTSRAGSSTISLGMARYISKCGIDAGLMELPISKPHLFNLANIERIILENYQGNETDIDVITNLYNSFPHEIENNEEYLPKNIEYNKDGHLTFYMADSRKPIIKADEWTYEKTLRLIQMACKNTVLIIDGGSNIQHITFSQYVSQLDAILVMIEPLVSECDWTQIKWFKELEDKGYPVFYFYNKVTPYSDTKLFNRFYGITSSEVPYINGATVQMSINKGFYLVDKAKELEKPLQKIVEMILPDFKSTKKKYI